MAQPRSDYDAGAVIPGTIYRVVRRIGSGGMGAVYEVEDTSIGRNYVLKAMHPDLCDRKDLAARMQAEARTLGRLSHPNIVEVVTAGVTADDPPRPYFVMERLEGHALREVLEVKGSLSLDHAIAITLELLSALAHAHASDVIHRDVKPDNIFLHRPRAGGGPTTTKLLDFGIMRIARSAPSETAGRFVGTLRYAAPEQLRGETASPQTDLYAAALVLFEMIAGRGPFDDEGDSQQVAGAHLKKRAPLLSSLRPVPEPLDALIAAALAKDVAERPRTAREFRDALRAVPDTPPAPAETDAPLPSLMDAPSPRATRGLVIAVAVAVVAAATGLALLAARAMAR